MHAVKHLSASEWPLEDRQAFQAAFAPGDIFEEDGGPGAHLTPGSRRRIITAYRRWLGFLKTSFPQDLEIPPAERITAPRVRDYVDHLALEVQPTTVAIEIAGLHYAARLIAPSRDWTWLKNLKSRLDARSSPLDRFDQLIPTCQTLDFGIELMEDALQLPASAAKTRITQYRDGPLIALLSVWPIRRRSIASLTVDRHIEIDPDGITILLHATDTKSKRPESFRIPDLLVPNMRRYLDDIRSLFPGALTHTGLWASYLGGRLSAGGIYDMVRRCLRERFGKECGLHDFRRAAATFLAIDAPEKIGLIPGVLQHTCPDVGDKHYNLARSMNAARRHSQMINAMRNNLAPRHPRKGP